LFWSRKTSSGRSLADFNQAKERYDISLEASEEEADYDEAD
jgi:hypothetical protein